LIRILLKEVGRKSVARINGGFSFQKSEQRHVEGFLFRFYLIVANLVKN